MIQKFYQKFSNNYTFSRATLIENWIKKKKNGKSTNILGIRINAYYAMSIIYFMRPNSLLESHKDLSYRVSTPWFNHFECNNKISYTYKIDVILKSYGSCEVAGFKCFLNYK